MTSKMPTSNAREEQPYLKKASLIRDDSKLYSWEMATTALQEEDMSRRATDMVVSYWERRKGSRTRTVESTRR